MTSRGKILDAVAEIARRELRRDPEDGLREEQRLVEDLRLDSIELLTLATAVEDHFLIRLDEDDEASIVAVGDLVDLVERKLAGKEP